MKKLEDKIEIVIPIKRRVQYTSEPYCGPLTYCALSGLDVSKVEEVHKKASIKPSIGFFYTSFLKLDPNTRAHIERTQNMLSSEDDKCFETMWKFEEHFQGISKEEFKEGVRENSKRVYEENKGRVTMYPKLVPRTCREIIDPSLEKEIPVGAMVIEDLGKCTKKERLLIPHWITIHGTSDSRDAYLVSNTYEESSSWVDKNVLLKRISDVRNHGFSPQLITLLKG